MNRVNPTLLNLDKFKSFLDLVEPYHVGICGGEPTLYPQLVELLTELKNRNIHSCLITNGSTLDSISVLPDNLSVGVGTDLNANTKLDTFIDSYPEYLQYIEVTITPVDLETLIPQVNYYRDRNVGRVNISTLAYQDSNPSVISKITPEYLSKLALLSGVPNVVFFGDSLINLYDFYDSSKEFDFSQCLCLNYLNVFSDGEIQFCDLRRKPSGLTLDNVTVESLRLAFQNKVLTADTCRYCSLCRKI